MRVSCLGLKHTKQKFKYVSLLAKYSNKKIGFFSQLSLSHIAWGGRSWGGFKLSTFLALLKKNFLLILRKFNDSFSGLNETYSTSHERTLFTGEVFFVFIVSYTSFFM